MTSQVEGEIDFGLVNDEQKRPPEPQRCKVFCCFYAEFDNKVGPKVCYQSPRNFMDQPIDLSFEKIHDMLQKSFDETEKNSTEPDADAVTAAATAAATAGVNTEGNTNNNNTQEHEQDSIFDATCDYIITGNELAGRMLNLSTHNFHVLTRPTVIFDEGQYERNSFLFCAGFVLRRSEDPRPFQPVLSKWAETLKHMEIEDHFLSQRKKPSLQPFLRSLLVSLNIGECNALLNSSNPLNLKLFRPPKLVGEKVLDHAVPILLRIDWHFQMYDWDLAINWVILHIDGVNTTKAISVKSEVDLEMVQACLRVLQHHGVVATVDMFFYSNRYESTPKAADLLRKKDKKLLQEAYDFCSVNKSQTMSSGDLPELDMVSSFPPQTKGIFPRGAEELHPQQEARQLKTALAELYYSFDRDLSFADVLAHKLSKDSRGEEGGVQQQQPKSSRKDDFWKTAFWDLDHRRVVIFGVIHGLIKRVHNYPFAMAPATTTTTTTTSGAPSTTRYSLKNGYNNNNSNTYSGSSSNTQDKSKEIALRVGQAMDGRTCDDAIVTQYERPIDELVQLVQSQTGAIVSSIYATT